MENVSSKQNFKKQIYYMGGGYKSLSSLYHIFELYFNEGVWLLKHFVLLKFSYNPKDKGRNFR